jgi:hypothetical protein
MTDFACTLPPPELRLRRAQVLTRLRARATHVEEHEDGYALHFPRELERELHDFVAFEAHCCAFIAMDVEARGAEAVLHLRGEPGAKPFMRAEFVDVEA